MVGCDRVTKQMAATSLIETPSQSFWADTVRLEYAENAGGFLSLGANLQPAIRTAIFKMGVGLGLLFLLLVVIKNRWTGWPLIGGSRIFAWGVSNWIDRVMRDNVTVSGAGSAWIGSRHLPALCLGVCHARARHSGAD